MKPFYIQNLKISENKPPVIIAEMSGNHNQSLDRALSIVDAAAKAGAHALKLQTYKAETMTLDCSRSEFYIDDPQSPWYGQTLFELYQRAHTPWHWHKPIFEKCKKLNMVCFSTPFDETSVDFLEELNVPAYKIAAFENTDIPLIKKVASTGKPVILSTGMAEIFELGETVSELKKNGCTNLVLLKCTSSYPADPKDSNILTLAHMRELFNCFTGLSDHTLGLGAAVCATALGAVAIEKHFTLSRKDGGVDAEFSVEPEELKQLVFETEQAHKALGKINYGPTKKEKLFLKHRRSLYAVENIKKDELFTKQNIRSIRPALGLAPKHLDLVIGRIARKDIEKGTPISWDLI
jgi:pseudaminic acid synthase